MEKGGEYRLNETLATYESVVLNPAKIFWKYKKSLEMKNFKKNFKNFFTDSFSDHTNHSFATLPVSTFIAFAARAFMLCCCCCCC